MLKKILSKILVGIGLLCCFYPLMSGLYDSWIQSRAVSSFISEMASGDQQDLDHIVAEARAYNNRLYSSRNGGITTERTNSDDYMSQLNFSQHGMMGSLEIPKIGVKLPILHGTGEDVLAKNVGHLEGSSLPVGGLNTRAVLTAHRGLPTAKLFTRLDEIVEGDQFFINTGSETLAYEVSGIEVIEPEEISVLDPVRGEDLVTLVTCTPYGLNTHRLLVTGHRVPYLPGVEAEIKQVGPSFRELLFSAVPFILLILAVYKPVKKLVRTRLKKGETDVKKAESSNLNSIGDI